MKKIYVFYTPKRIVNSEDYEVEILEKVSKKFKLGRLLRYDSISYDKGGITYIKGIFERGKAIVKFKEGGEAIALVKKYKRTFRIWI
ncbi:MAG: hypothetical protein OWQ50_05445 [Acidianus infernus]|nr:hypothetical protein [Acidianus infernus]